MQHPAQIHTNKELALSYLHSYQEKNIQMVAELFAEDIILRDWKIRVTGKEKALEETKKNFDAVETLLIEVLNIYENNNTVAAELKIVIDNKEELYVVDLITINDNRKISSIKAFVGRGDDE